MHGATWPTKFKSHLCTVTFCSNTSTLWYALCCTLFPPVTQSLSLSLNHSAQGSTHIPTRTHYFSSFFLFLNFPFFGDSVRWNISSRCHVTWCPWFLALQNPHLKAKKKILKYSFHFLIFASRKIWSQLMQIVGLAGTAAMQPVSMFFFKFNSRLTFVRL